MINILNSTNKPIGGSKSKSIYPIQITNNENNKKKKYCSYNAANDR